MGRSSSEFESDDDDDATATGASAGALRFDARFDLGAFRDFERRKRRFLTVFLPECA